MQEDASRADQIAAALVGARRQARPLGAFPIQLPESLRDSYRIQDSAIRLVPDVIAGWKVGRILSPMSEQYGADRLAGPIFSKLVIRDAGGEPPVSGVFAGGFGAAEAEFIIQLARSPDPAKTHYSLEEAVSLIGRVHAGIEIASSPLAPINDLGPAAIAADFGNNNGMVLGAEVAQWRSDSAFEWPVVTKIDGIEVGRSRASSMPDGPVGAVRFLLELCAARHVALPAGTWISTGAITGVHVVRPGQQVEAQFGVAHVVRCSITATSPQSPESKP